MTDRQPKPNLSFLDIVDICDNAHIRLDKPHAPFDTELLVPFHLEESRESPAVGLLRPVIVEQLKLENARAVERSSPEVWRIDAGDASTNGRPWVSFRNWFDTPLKRNEAMKELCERWRDSGLFPDVCGPTKWRAELYPVYKNPFGSHDYPESNDNLKTLNYAFEMERSACALFGIVTYGVHLTIFEESGDGQDLRIWVPTRARTKPTWPGYLDNTVAGGIPSGMSPFESLVKECMEEASLDDRIARKHIRCTGAVSYFFRHACRTAAGWLQPEVEYVYDLSVPRGVDSASFQPKPSDGEVECFELLNQGEVIDRMRAGLFKPNCAIVLIDLFIRRGIITPENEPDYMEIITRLHGRFNYASW
ncbi:nudix hydrolase 20 [Pluteus cervinus]|uniref:Nudix hydrolase 20 n=1 Tax=Pluteus cervinus TaxID=181527 RepID=A0ACD3BD56_9AGAR|nr:nudix hydrolase 20 [Pluteus cervinus]